MIKNYSAFIVFALGLHWGVFAQDACYLGVSGKDDDTIIAVFGLSDEQVTKMKNWSDELRQRNSSLKVRAQQILQKGTFSQPQEWHVLSSDYHKLLDSIKQNVMALDQRVLTLFNDEQYNLYIELCHEVSRSPIYANRQVNEK